MSLSRIDWLWFLVGVAVAIVIHQAMTHPASPARKLTGMGGEAFL